MATDGDASRQPPEDEMLPDEREVIAERIEELDEDATSRTVAEVAEDLGIDVD